MLESCGAQEPGEAESTLRSACDGRQAPAAGRRFGTAWLIPAGRPGSGMSGSGQPAGPSSGLVIREVQTGRVSRGGGEAGWPGGPGSRLRACGAKMALSQAELDLIDALPAGVHATTRVLACALQAGHRGPCLALAQAYSRWPERERWLRWNESSRIWLDIEDGQHCYTEGPLLPGSAGNALCVLPGYHPGRHSFEFPAPAPAPA